METPYLLEVRGLRKSYGANDVLKGVDLAFKAGEVHAFLGANGAGKSTLLACLSGAAQPDSGSIVVEGESFDALSPRQAFDVGIGIIYQHFQVVEGLTVADNIFLGSEIRRGFAVNVSEQNRQAAELMSRFDMSINPSDLLDKLTVGERQLIEIVRALRLKPKVLILDEPTAALGETEGRALHVLVQDLAHRDGLAIVYVSHLLDEVDEVADVVTVLRDGAVVWTKDVADTNIDDIAGAIAPSLGEREVHNAPDFGDVIIKLDNLQCDYTGPVDVEIRAGEIVGIYGLLGSGRTDLLETMVGARSQVSGTLSVHGMSSHFRSPRQAFAAGMALVAADRREQSLFGDISATDNVLMPHFSKLTSRLGIRRRSVERALFNEYSVSVGLKPNNPNLEANLFSGGNAQKLALGRWLLTDIGVQVLLLDEPTQGVDVGARAELYELLRVFVGRDACVLFASSDAAEVSQIADQVIVLNRGQMIERFETAPSPSKIVSTAHRRVVLANESDS